MNCEKCNYCGHWQADHLMDEKIQECKAGKCDCFGFEQKELTSLEKQVAELFAPVIEADKKRLASVFKRG